MEVPKKTLLITGVAGFVGFALARALASNSGEYSIVGIDNINEYYDVNLKYDRLNELGFSRDRIEKNKYVISSRFPHLKFIVVGLEDEDMLRRIVTDNHINIIVNLAAQAGVRYSLTNPRAYINSNIIGFSNLMEVSKDSNIEHFIYASSSSVYGINSTAPFHEEQRTDSPVSLYAATKKSNELIAHVYSHLYKIKTTGLRFFTVYGPWGRPDMAPFLFANAILNKKPINVFNNGKLKRDFTYIDDIIDGVIKVIQSTDEKKKMYASDTNANASLYNIYNIGNSSPVKLMDFISLIEKELGEKADLNLLSMQPGDVYETYADTSALTRDMGYIGKVSIEEGVKKFIAWFLEYYQWNEKRQLVNG